MIEIESERCLQLSVTQSETIESKGVCWSMKAEHDEGQTECLTFRNEKS